MGPLRDFSFARQLTASLVWFHFDLWFLFGNNNWMFAARWFDADNYIYDVVTTFVYQRKKKLKKKSQPGL